MIDKPHILIIGERTLPLAVLYALFPPSKYQSSTIRVGAPLTSSYNDFSLLLLNHSNVDAAYGVLDACKDLQNSPPCIWLACDLDAVVTATAFRKGVRDVLLRPEPVDVRERVESLLEQQQPVPTSTPGWKRSLAEWLVPKTQKPTSPTDLPRLRVQFFGTLNLWLNGRSLTINLTQRERSLLAYFLYHHPQPQHKDRLVQTFWPDNTPESGRNLLHVLLSRLRTWARQEQLHPDFIQLRDHCYQLPSDIEITSDCQQFRSYFQTALGYTGYRNDAAMENLVEALRLYRERFLEDLYGEQWVQVYQAALEENYLQLLNRLSDLLLANGQYDEVVELSNRILRTNAYSEAAHLRLVRAYQAMGYRDKAVQQLRRCQDKLAELRLHPTAEMLALLQVLIGTADGGASYS